MRSELFEETLKQHKDSLTEELVQLGKHRQAQLVGWDIEQNESDYEFYFSAGWNAQQSKVDELTKQRDSFIKAYEIEMNKSVELQKRVDAVKTLIEEYRDPLTEDKTFQHALSIVAYELEQALKGGSDE